MADKRDIPYVFCFHGHFYQPPRQDPLTGDIPDEPGAAPFRNWNEKINEQCYRPNAAIGNFENISFDIGPTLMDWIKDRDEVSLRRIIDQDKMNFERYGAGNAMAQPYHHIILPLAPRHDKITEITWGLLDFEDQYGHKPGGMWLPETAVDLETLEVLAESKIKFTILAPWQTTEKNLDTMRPYRVELSGEKNIAVFFYHQELSTRISFDPGATMNADVFVQQHLLSKFDSTSTAPQYILIATDGEVYGHHYPYRDKFLSYLMDQSIKNRPLRQQFPELWLKNNPSLEPIQIKPNTSWSCHHGIRRWMGNCDCTPDSRWKAPLRKALDQIALAIDNQYLDLLKNLFPDPWQIRHQYIRAVNRKNTIAELVKEAEGERLSEVEVKKLPLLLAAQFERLKMFTSCGWFFDEFDRIEPKNNIAFAAHAVWLTYQATNIDLSPLACDYLKLVKSKRMGIKGDAVFNHYLERFKTISNPYNVFYQYF